MKIDTASTKEILHVMNKEDQKVALAVQEVLPNVEVAVEFVSELFQKEGRLIYVGAGTSGRTPYVIGALRYAKSVKAKTVALSCNGNSLIGKEADHSIEVVVGPEVLTGSTRLKAASAHKMILNMISTAAMIKVGKAYENLMIDVHVSNEKLKERAIGIICKITGVSYEQASQTLEEANNEVKQQ